MTTVVATYGDLIGDGDLNVARADAIASELRAGHDLAAHAPGWLIADKDYPASPHHDEIIAGTHEHETDKAHLLSRDGHEAWFPKQLIRAYVLAEDADVSQLDAGTTGESA